MNDREKLIEETLQKEGVEGLKKLNVTSDEIDRVVNRIDRKIEKLNMEGASLISKELGYNLPMDYCTYYSKQITTLHIKPNLFKVNNNEKMISYLFSMDKDSKTYIMNFQKFDSKYEQELVPFAELEFGDLLCFNRKNNSIVYYNHEEDSVTKVSDCWKDFEKTLYE